VTDGEHGTPSTGPAMGAVAAVIVVIVVVIAAVAFRDQRAPVANDADPSESAAAPALEFWVAPTPGEG
jgi:hypothetical protein